MSKLMRVISTKYFFMVYCFCATVTPTYALYDPAPAPSLAAVEGAWRGTMQYRDYQPPFGRVTLPTQLYAALLSPNELALHYVFDDGPNKIIHSYDRLKIDLVAKAVSFTSAKAGEIIVAKIVSSREAAGMLHVVAEVENVKEKTKAITRYTLALSATDIEILKEEGADAAAEFLFRSKYSFTRVAK